MGIVDHARAEFRFKKWPGKEPMQSAVCKDVIALLTLLASQGHSGTSAPYVIELFSRLASFKTLGPLTGKRSEWCEVTKGLYQNKRCSTVFKEKGKAYDINGIIWKDKDGSCFTNYKSRTTITFPYEPAPQYRKATRANLSKV